MATTDTDPESTDYEHVQERLDELAERVADLEAQLADGGDAQNRAVATTDRRDRAVLERLEPGETVTLKRIRQLYRGYTDVTTTATLRDRTEGLLGRDDFERVARRKWRYTPEGDS